ncbi:MAG: T9SS type A sorting domain-containing protein [Balneolaceae bacterium]|nr:T9SS type A sorting domain-containing protein [Balneolaceae bacterium]
MIKQAGFFIFIFICVFTLPGETLFAQVLPNQHVEGTNHPILSAIQQEVQSGKISKDEALLQSVYAGFAPERMNKRYLAKSTENLPIRCLTPVLMEFENVKDQLHAATVSEIEALTAPKSSADMQSHKSPSGNFILYYEVEGEDAVPTEDSDGNGTPDYIEKAAFAADSSYRHEVNEIGFMDFLKSDPYEIYFLDFGFYGTTRSSGSTTSINVHRNFEGFPANTHPEGDQIGALYATIAHEIKHAIQYATNRWKGEAGNTAWSEMDATLMEEIVFDDVNDYYNYIMQYDNEMNDWDRGKARSSSIFGNPENPTPGSYNHITWMLYFSEMFGTHFWVDVWNIIRNDYLNSDNPEDLIPFLDAVRQALELENMNFPQEHLMNHLWHMTAGPNFTTPGFGFEERTEYPSAKFTETLTQPPDSVTNQYLQSNAAHYLEVMPSNITPGQPSISLESDVNGIGFGVIGFFKNGEIDVDFTVNPLSNIQTLQTTWSWDNLVDMRIAVVNTHRDSSGSYNLIVSSTIPDEDTITQNYPNPFNPTTNIEFSLTEQKDVTVEVYDRIGRKISTLVDDQLGRGFHTVQFDGTGLASGVYFYRIVTDQAAITRKMVLVK